MGFIEYMKLLPSPKNEIVGRIADECKVSNVSVYRWIQGKTTPNALCRSIIARVLDMNEDELFPVN